MPATLAKPLPELFRPAPEPTGFPPLRRPLLRDTFPYAPKRDVQGVYAEPDTPFHTLPPELCAGGCLRVVYPNREWYLRFHVVIYPVCDACVRNWEASHGMKKGVVLK